MCIRDRFITDAAINVYPTLADKRDIIQNAIDLAHALGIAVPRVAILSAIAVSYTHLDVYKRQEPRGASAMSLRSMRRTIQGRSSSPTPRSTSIRRWRTSETLSRTRSIWRTLWGYRCRGWRSCPRSKSSPKKSSLRLMRRHFARWPIEAR